MIINKTKKICISINEIRATSFLSQARGLMFKKKQNCLMTFKRPQIISLHNFFVFYPLDILLLDKEQKIIEIKRNFKPCTLWTSKNSAAYCLEVAIPSQYDIGDELEITNL